LARVALYDTTLRDGTQRAGISLSVDDKLRIAELLDSYGFDYIEGGWPGSNPKDEAFFPLAAKRLRHAKLAAFGSTARRGERPETDANLRALLAADTPVATIFGKASPLHVTDILGMTLKENLLAVEASVRYLKAHGREVVFDAEHFFDGARLDRPYALDVLKAAEQGGADWIVLCDTNGGSLPDWIRELTEAAARLVRVPLGVHAHDDAGLGVANSLAAVQAGVRMVQGTINGYGERCGNANLCTIWPNLVLKLGFEAGRRDSLPRLTELSRRVAEIANLAPDDAAPYVGQNAFTHKAGVHVGAVRKNPAAYEHVPPETVGQTRRVLVSELAGRSNLLYHFEDLDDASGEAKELTARIKQLEALGYQFEEAEASVAVLVHRSRGQIPRYYEVERFHVSSTWADSAITEATVRVRVGDQAVLEVADGDGPVHALDLALRRALTRFYPVLAEVRLTDYKVRVLDGQDGTAARVRVLVQSAFRGEDVRTVGVSRNILQASWQALLDALDYVLWKAGAAPVGRPLSVSAADA
jgi:2-isopropylmalate synthase